MTYKHKKTGKLYEVISMQGIRTCNDSPDRREFVIYKEDERCPQFSGSGLVFFRNKEEFLEKFEKEEENIEYSGKVWCLNPDTKKRRLNLELTFHKVWKATDISPIRLCNFENGKEDISLEEWNKLIEYYESMEKEAQESVSEQLDKLYESAKLGEKKQ